MDAEKTCEICGKPHHAKGLCRNCYMRERRSGTSSIQRDQETAWRNRNPDKVKAANLKAIRAKTCRIIKKHEAEMSDDPEALTTDFIKTMIGIDYCE